MPPAKRSKRDGKLDFAIRLSDNITAILLRLIPWGAAIWIMSFVAGVLTAYAGKSTFAEVGVQFVTEFKIDRWLAYAFGGGGIAYGLNQRRLRRNNVERLSGRPKELESRLDENRSSSRLTPRGTTNPEDIP